jgi:hypothetical protein
MAWGGAVEQAREHAAGNAHAKNWQDEAKKIIENTVSLCTSSSLVKVTELIQY